MLLQKMLKSLANSVHLTEGAIACDISLIAKRNRNKETNTVDHWGTPLYYMYSLDGLSLAPILESSVCQEILYEIK